MSTLRDVLALTVLLALALATAASCGGPTASGPDQVAPAAGSAPSPDPSPASARAAASGAPRLLLLTAINGYVEPCGCTVDLTLGGIDRLATRVEEERALGPTVVLMVGSTLFDPHVNEPHLADQESAKAAVLARALERIGVAAVVPTQTELKYGPGVVDPIRKLWALPDVTANARDGQPRILTVGSVRIGVFGLVDPAAGPTLAGPPSPVEPAALAAVERLRHDGAQVVVGLAALPRKQVRALAKAIPGVDLWVLGESPNEEVRSQPAGGSYVIEAGDRGRHLGRVVLHDVGPGPGPLADPGGDRARALNALDLQIKMRKDLRVRSGDSALDAATTELEQRRAALEAEPFEASGRRFEYALLPIAKEVVPDPQIAQWLVDYNGRLKDINLASQAPVPPVPEFGSGYAGGKECVDCHEESQKVWLATPHAKAWETLVKVNKTFDAECVSCHVTGWLMPGGVNLKNLTGRTDVQCEQCHGPGQKHVDVGGDDASTRRMVPEAVCVVCHNRFHSPKFDYATYLPKILGPGHAQKR